MNILDSFTKISACLSMKDALLVVATFALLTHLVFNRLEPLKLPILACFFVLIPTALSILFIGQLSVFASIVITFGTYHAVLLTSIAFYRLSPFHPLARFPGPLGMKLSSLLVYKEFRAGKRHERIRQLHQQYQSDVIRIGPNEISIIDASAITPVLGTTGLPKGPQWDGRSAHNAYRSLISLRDPAVHAKRRLPWGRGLSVAAIKDYEPTLAERITQMVDIVLENAESTMELSQLIKNFTHDFMGDMAFGGGSELMRDGDVDGLMRILQGAIGSAIMVETTPWLPYYLPNGLIQLQQSAGARAKRRIVKGASKKDLFHYLNNEDEASPVSPALASVAAEGALATVAGSDTTAGTLCNIVYFLMQNRDTYERLQAEVDRYYPPGENALDCKYHAQMPFLDAVISETLRVCPVLPSGSQRATREGGMALRSCYIPPHTSVRIHTWTVHHDPRNFSPMPDMFWPERWLIAEDPSAYKTSIGLNTSEPFIHNLNAYIPWSYGPSNCVGKHLALKEMKMVLCHLLQQVDLKWAQGFNADSYIEDMHDCFTLEVGRLEVAVTARDVKA